MAHGARSVLCRYGIDWAIAVEDGPPIPWPCKTELQAARVPGCPVAQPWPTGLWAIQSISTRAPRARSTPPTVIRAGGEVSKTSR